MCPRPASEPGPQAWASGRCGFLWGMRTSPPAARRRPVSTGPFAGAVAIPLADLAGAGGRDGRGRHAGGLGGWLVAGYAAGVLVVLSAVGLHRLRICLRVCDQSGRIIWSYPRPALAVAPWSTAGHAVALAVGPPGCSSPPA